MVQVRHESLPCASPAIRTVAPLGHLLSSRYNSSIAGSGRPAPAAFRSASFPGGAP